MDGTVYELDLPTRWGDATARDRWVLDNVPLQQGFTPGVVTHVHARDFRLRDPRTHEDGLYV